jgi:hypothetical protein
VAAVITATALGAVGCGASSGGSGPATNRAPAAALPGGGAPLLAASQLPRLRAVTRTLGREGVVLATPIPGLPSRLVAWGFRRAQEREFTGRAHQLSHVVSMGVDFAGAAGAAGYERLLVAQAGEYLGAGATVSRLRTPGSISWMIQLQSCGCHPEPPTVIAVMLRRAELSWLSVTGPGATPARVRFLARRLAF